VPPGDLLLAGGLQAERLLAALRACRVQAEQLMPQEPVVR
jgi:hypothetical protein